MKSGSAKVSENKYYPYDVIQEGGSDKYLYTGKELDKSTGLYITIRHGTTIQTWDGSCSLTR